MKTSLLISIVIALAAGGAAGVAITNNRAAVPAELNSTPIAEDFLSLRPELESLPAQMVSDQEEQGLVYMREEEKLARDVYQTLYDQWGLQIFSNIAQSEQTHTESVRALLVKYDITDPVTNDTVGIFANDDLAQLYANLVEQGSGSAEDALQVGALIEDLDIFDLQNYLAQTDNDDIALVYENLMRGSRNHLRAFTRQIENRGGTYEPQYITAAEYTDIIDGGTETGSGQSGHGGRGWGRGQQNG